MNIQEMNLAAVEIALRIETEASDTTRYELDFSFKTACEEISVFLLTGKFPKVSDEEEEEEFIDADDFVKDVLGRDRTQGDYLAGLMARDGYNSQELATKIRVGRTTVSQWLRGISHPTYKNSKKLGKFFNCEWKKFSKEEASK